MCASCQEPKARSELEQCFWCESWFCEACVRPSRHRCQTYRELGPGTAPVLQAPLTDEQVAELQAEKDKRDRNRDTGPRNRNTGPKT